MTGSAAGRRTAALLVWLSLFAILYTAGERFGIWPQMPPGAFRDVDLWIGGAAVAGLAAALWTRRRRSA